jgi:hypothetical protein
VRLETSPCSRHGLGGTAFTIGGGMYTAAANEVEVCALRGRQRVQKERRTDRSLQH